jgi:glycosyltransferase involved in cell wall biosynthesis
MANERDIAIFNVHFPGVEAVNLILLRVMRLYRGQVVLSLHGSDIRAAHQESPFAKWIWRWMLRHASAVVACSNGLKEEALLLEPRAPALTIYNGIDMPRFSRTPGGPERLKELTGKKVIVNVGGFEYRKGHDILLRAFKRIRDQRSDVVLLLIGKSGPASVNVRRFIEDHKLQRDVVILENVPHEKIYGLLKQADVFALSTRWIKKVMGEGFALAVLEAAAAQLPVVATASCGVRELIQHQQTGLVTPLDDSDALADAIVSMLEHPEEAARMAGALHDLVKKRFTWEKAAQEYAALAGHSFVISECGKSTSLDEALAP